MFKNGYMVEKDKDGNIKGISINTLNSKDILNEVIEGNEDFKSIKNYLNLNNIPEVELINIIGGFIKDPDFKGKDNKAANAALLMWGIAKSWSISEKKQVINILNTGIQEFNNVRKMNELRQTINYSYENIKTKIKEKMEGLLNEWKENVVQKLRENPNNKENSVEKVYSDTNAFGNALKKEEIVRFSSPLCNIGTSNYLNLMGYSKCCVISDKDSFDGQDGIYFARAKDPDENNTFVGGATQLIKLIDSKKDDFTSLDNILNFTNLEGLTDDQFKQTMTTIFQLFSAAGYAVIGTMYKDQDSHIFPVYNGLSLDINFQYKRDGTFQWGEGVPLWVSIGGKEAWDDVLEYTKKDGTFNFNKEEWLKDKIEEYKKLKKKDGTNYTEEEAKAMAEKSSVYKYIFNFYILNYPVYMFPNSWGFTTFNYK